MKVPTQEAKSESAATSTSLHRNLSRRQLTMIVMGSAIGTGLFLGSGLAVHFGGPAVILAYVFSSGLALMISWALAEMSVVHPSAGSLGVFAGTYLNSWAGYMVMVSYWAAAVISIGQEIVAASIYCQFWLPGLPQWFWVVLFASTLIYVNSWNVGRFGEFEYWFALIKVVTIVLFIVFGGALLLGLSSFHSPGLANYSAHGGFLPNGWKGLWFAVPFALISFIGVELIAVTAGEVKNPDQAIPKASRSIVWRLILFYVASMALLLAIAPWSAIGITVSPFVFVFHTMGVPAASGVMNFVVLTAALSGANSSLYAATRMLYSMAEQGLTPRIFRRTYRKGVPLFALLGSAAGLAGATLAAIFIPTRAFIFMIAAAYFQIMFVWIAILLAYVFFRKRHAAEPLRFRAVKGHPYTTLGAIGSLVAILVTTWWIPSMRVTAICGVAWLALASGYYAWSQAKGRAVQSDTTVRVSSG